MNKIRTAVIGIGNMGKHHVRIYSQISKLIAIADISSQHGKILSAEYKVNYYKNYIDLLDKEKPDAVSIAVPTKFHKEIAVECLMRKIPTLVEKPIAANYSEAEVMVDVAKKNNTFLMIGHIERYNPAVVKLKLLIDQGKLGKIISLLAIRVGLAPPIVKNSDVSLELAIHDVDIFNLLLNEYPQRKNIIKKSLFNGNIADSAVITLEYKDASSVIFTNWITPIKIRKLYISGTDGFGELDYITQKLIFYKKVIELKDYGDFFELVSLVNTPKKEIYISKKEPLKEELKFFLRSIIDKKKTDVDYALAVLKILQ